MQGFIAAWQSRWNKQKTAASSSKSLLQLQLSDLKGEQQELAEVIGLESFIALVKIYGGTSIYVPKPDGLEKSLRNEQIRKEFTGYNYRKLSRKYGLTESMIRSIVSEMDRKMKQDFPPDQLSLFAAFHPKP